jgi:hypothetical protein
MAEGDKAYGTWLEQFGIAAEWRLIGDGVNNRS